MRRRVWEMRYIVEPQFPRRDLEEDSKNECNHLKLNIIFAVLSGSVACVDIPVTLDNPWQRRLTATAPGLEKE
jgi:hypothetical protein